MIVPLLSDTQKNIFNQAYELDFSFEFKGKARFRVNIYRQKGNPAAALRLIPFRIPPVEELGLPSIVTKLTELKQGFVLVTGPTGHGKSTTLASFINKINHERAVHIITIEDPIEYLFVSNRSIIDQRELYRDTNSFAEALRRCLRQDPDVIVVGEMRDLETISTALTAAETGHLVLGTIHTPDAPQTIERIIDVFPPYQQQQVRLQLASALQGVISQQLVARASGKGRVMAPEIMIATPGIRNMIREQAIEQIRTAIQTGAQYGMKTMDKSLKELCEKGIITYETAVTHANNLDELKSLLKKQ